MVTFRSHKRRKGQILVFFLSIMMIGLLLATALLTLQGSVNRNAKDISEAKDAFYLAESGLEKGLQQFIENSNYTGETFSLGNGSVSVAILPGETANERYITSEATVAEARRQLKVKMTTEESSTAISFRYGIQVGTLGFTTGNNSIVNGNVYSNQNITGNNGTIITGDAFAVGTISSQITVQGQKRTGQPIEPLPTFDAALWKAEAQEGSKITGNYTPTNGSAIGPLFINGDLNFTNNSVVTIHGPVYASGSVIFGNGTQLIVDESLGGGSTMIISERTITIGNSLTITNNQSGGRLLIGSTYGSIAINIGNNAGSVNAPLYAPNGMMLIGNNARAVAFAARGIVLGNGAIVTYDSGLANISFSTGPSGTWTIEKGSIHEY